MNSIKKLANLLFIICLLVITGLYLKQALSRQDKYTDGDSVKVSNISGDRFEVLIKEAIDGDTFNVIRIDNSTKLRVRLIGVNTPESVDKYRTIECYGKEASDYAKTSFSNKKALMIYDDKKQKQDNHGRELAYLNVIKEDGDSYDIGEVLLKLGIAKEYTYNYEYYQLQESYRQLQKQSRAENKGLWSACK